MNSPLSVGWSFVTTSRTCVVVVARSKGTASCVFVLPVTVAAVCQALPSHVSTVKSCGTPSAFDWMVMPGRFVAGVVIVSVSG